MIQEFTKEELRTWFRQNVDGKFLSYENDFIGAISEAGQNYTTDENDSDVFLNEDWLHFTDPVAQLIVGDYNIRIEKLTLDLLLVILCSGGIDVFFGGAVSIPTVCMNVFQFAINAGQYFSKLQPTDTEFYKFLTTNYYTYSDRINDLIDFTKSGFSLSEAIDEYCRQQVEQTPSADIECIRREAEQSAAHLEKEDILSKRESGDFYIKF